MRSFFVLATVVGAALSTGCGPIFSTYLIVDAEAQLAGAKAAEAERYAVYEYTASEAYLKKAHEELGYADYGPAIDYAYKAADLATQGIERATEARHKASEGPTGEDAGGVRSSPADEPAAAPKKVIIKKITAPTVPASDPSVGGPQ